MAGPGEQRAPLGEAGQSDVGQDRGVGEGEGVGAEMQREVTGEAAGGGVECELEHVVRRRGGDPEPQDAEGVTREIEVGVGKAALGGGQPFEADVVDDGACNPLPGGEGGRPDLVLGLGRGCGGEGYEGGYEAGEG